MYRDKTMTLNLNFLLIVFIYNIQFILYIKETNISIYNIMLCIIYIIFKIDNYMYNNILYYVYKVI